jgi:hypothetical protein
VSETDSFIQEVTDEVRQDRMFRLWKQYGPYAIGAVVIAVAGTAGYNWMKHREIEKARETGGAFLASDLSSVKDQQALLDKVKGRATILARMRLAAATAESGDAEGAAALYREVASEAELGRPYTDLARLEAVRLSVGKTDRDELEAELGPLIAEDGPYRLLALELRAAIRLDGGDVKGAHADLNRIIGNPQATRATSERALALLLSSGGEPPAGTK